MLEKTVSILETTVTKGKLSTAEAVLCATELHQTCKGSGPKNRYLYTPLREAEANLRDLAYASANGFLTPGQVRKDAKVILKSVLSSVSNIAERAKVSIASLAATLDPSTGQEPVVLGEQSDLDTKSVNAYYEQTRRVPRRLKRPFSVITKIPLVVIGLYGERLAKLRALVKVNTFVESYCVVENQMLFGLDVTKLRDEVGAKKVADADFLYEYASDILSTYEGSEPLSIASEKMHTYGAVHYFWVMPTRLLNKIISKIGGNFADEWDLIRKANMAVFDREDRNITDERLDLIFSLAARGKKIDDIVEKVQLSKVTGPSLVSRLLLGEEMPERTFTLRGKYKDKIKERHRELVRLRQLTEAHDKVTPVLHQGPYRFWRDPKH